MALISIKRMSAQAGLFPAVFLGILSIDPASATTGETKTEVINISGIRVGDAVLFNAGVGTNNDCMVTSVGVTATDQLTIKLRNQNAGTVDFGAFDLYVAIFRS